jgi:hypothetical protein
MLSQRGLDVPRLALVKSELGENGGAFGGISPSEKDAVGVPKGEGDAGAFQVGGRDLIEIEGVAGQRDDFHNGTNRPADQRRPPQTRGDRTNLRGSVDRRRLVKSESRSLGAVAASTATTTTVAASTPGAFFAGLGDADVHAATVEFLAVQGADGALGFGVGPHGDEGESLGLAGLAVGDDVDFADGAVRREGVLKGGLSGVVGEASDK